MAYILKPNTTLTLKGVDFDELYLVIDKMIIDKRTCEVFVTYYTYPSAELKTNRNNSFRHARLKPSIDDYNTYFCPSVVAENGDQFKLAYQWLANQEWTPAVIEVDEEGNQTVVSEALLFKDLFVSDEV